MDHPEFDTDEWLTSLRSRTYLALRRMIDRKNELEIELEKIDEIIELRKSIRELREMNARIEAGNDQLRAELKEKYGRTEDGDRTET